MGTSKTIAGIGKRTMQRIERQSALSKLDAQIQSKKSIIQTAIACKYSTWNIELKEKELEELYKKRNALIRQ